MKNLLGNGLIMVIYNWKGLKEENYLYTVEEFKRRNSELAEAMEKYSGEWTCDVFSADKTYVAKKTVSEDELFEFLNGAYNDTEQSETDANWYWENRCDDLFDEEPFSCMMKTCLLEYAARRRCSDCVCLFETSDGDWECNCCEKNCRDVWRCPEDEDDDDLLAWLKEKR